MLVFGENGKLLVDIAEIGHIRRPRDPIDVLLDSKMNEDEFKKILSIFPVLGSDGRYGYKYAYNMARASVDVEISLSEYQKRKKNGTNKTNCSKIHWRKSAKEMAGNQSSKKVGTSDWRT